VGEADGTGEGDSPGVAKFVPSASLLSNERGVGTGVNWGSKMLTLVGVAAAAAPPVCAPAFVFAVVFVPVRAFVPVCVAAVELPLELPSPLATPPVIPSI
jgi:hypothetical protein